MSPFDNDFHTMSLRNLCCKLASVEERLDALEDGEGGGGAASSVVMGSPFVEDLSTMVDGPVGPIYANQALTSGGYNLAGRGIAGTGTAGTSALTLWSVVRSHPSATGLFTARAFGLGHYGSIADVSDLSFNLKIFQHAMVGDAVSAGTEIFDLATHEGANLASSTTPREYGVAVADLVSPAAIAPIYVARLDINALDDAWMVPLYFCMFHE